MKAAVLVGKQKVEIKEIDAPRPGPGEVLIAPKYAGICGTDMHIWDGQFEGRVRYPRVMGHEFAGIVQEIGEGVERVSPGEKVCIDPIMPCGFCTACREGSLSACSSLRLRGVDLDGGFAEAVVASEEQVFRLPERVGVKEGAMVEILSIGMHAVTRGQIDPGDFAVVLGAGRVGLSILSVLKTTAAGTIVVTDVEEYRLGLARKLGADYCVNAARKNAVKEVLSLTDGRGADRVFEAVGHARKSHSGLQPVAEATEMIRNAGRVVILGQGPDASPVMWKTFVWKEATLIASRVSRGEFPRVISAFEKRVIDPLAMVTHEVPLDYVPDAFQMLADGGREAVKILVKID
jgi:threonine dehydrogenase-like Zn-dependent dehydrogenase